MNDSVSGSGSVALPASAPSGPVTIDKSALTPDGKLLPAAQCPFAFATFHNLQGFECLVRFDQIVGVNGGTATAEEPTDPKDPSAGITKKVFPVSVLTVTNTPREFVVAERVDQVAEIMNKSFQILNRQMATGPKIALPGAMG